MKKTSVKSLAVLGNSPKVVKAGAFDGEAWNYLGGWQLTSTFTEEGVDSRFEGMTFVLTGGLEGYSRKEAEDIIEKFGGKCSRFCF